MVMIPGFSPRSFPHGFSPARPSPHQPSCRGFKRTRAARQASTTTRVWSLLLPLSLQKKMEKETAARHPQAGVPTAMAGRGGHQGCTGGGGGAQAAGSARCVPANAAAAAAMGSYYYRRRRACTSTVTHEPMEDFAAKARSPLWLSLNPSRSRISYNKIWHWRPRRLTTPSSTPPWSTTSRTRMLFLVRFVRAGNPLHKNTIADERKYNH